MREHYTHTVGPPLQRYVTLAVGYRYAGAPAGVHVGMPSGTLTLVVPFDEPLVLSGAGLSRPTPFEGVLAGLATAPTLIHHEGRQHGVQLTLTPAGARALFGLPAAELAERSVELEDVVGRVARSVRDPGVCDVAGAFCGVGAHPAPAPARQRLGPGSVA